MQISTMKTSLIPIVLFCLFRSVVSSNPDSVIVQDSSEDNENNKSSPILLEDPDSVIVLDSSQVNGRNRSAAIRVEDGQVGPMEVDERPRRLPVVRIMRPYVIGSRKVWREVGLQSFDEARDPLSSVWKDFNNNRRLFSGPTGQNAFRVRPYSANIPQRPQNNVERNNGGAQAFGGETPSNSPSDDEPIKPVPGVDRSGTGTRNNGALSLPPRQPNNNHQNRRQQGYNPNNYRFGVNAANFGVRRLPQPQPPPPQQPPPPPQPQPPQRPAYQGQRPPRIPVNTSNRGVALDSNLFASLVNNFAFKLVERLDSQSNFVVSPLSIFVALSMCYLGSDGRTKAQLEQVLGMNDQAVHGQRLHQGIMDLMSLVAAESSSDQLFVANGMFLGKNFTTNAQFEEDIRRYYSAELMHLDFGNPQASLPVINEWVARNTRNEIPNLVTLPPPAQMRLLLLNAIYFKGIWKTLFPVNLTVDGPFRSIVGIDKEVPTMTLLGESFPFYRSDEHRHSFIKLPYDGDQISMIIALPYGESDRPMPSMTDEILCNLREAMTNTQLDVVAIPKFRLEFTSSLRRPLMQLGITDIFTRNVVNFSKMRQENDVYVSAILHKAVVDVNEEGTTAGAATAVRFVPLTIRNTETFVASHPFAFYIVHERSGLVLFYGKILDLFGKPSGYRRGNVNISPRPNPEGNRGENANLRPMPNPEDNRRQNVNVRPMSNPENRRENVNARPMPNPEDNRRQNVNVRPMPNPEDNRRQNVNIRPMPNPEDNRRQNVNVRPMSNPENRRENVNVRPMPNPEDNRRENVNVRPMPNPEENRRENANVRPMPDPEDNRRENVNARPMPNPEDYRRENANVRPKPENFRGTASNRNPSRTGIHGAVNFENTD